MKSNGGARPTLAAAVVILLLGALAWRLLHLYSVARPYEAFVPPTRDFLRAALAQDSNALVRTGAAAPAVRWALETARQNPTGLRDLVRRLSVVGGRRTGDATWVIFRGSSGGNCLNRPLSVTFVGAGPDTRIQDISTDCGSRP